MLKSMTGKCSGVQIVERADEMSRILVASDLAITKGSYATGLELEALGVPTIVLGHESNPVDLVYSKAARNTDLCWLDEMTGPRLAQLILSVLNRERPAPREER